MKISCIDKSLREVLESGYYRIPRFQRPFSWDKENIDEFWDDTIVNSDSDYFIGSIVTYKASEDTQDIVDGQQRLTTITMILCSIRDSLKGENLDDLAKGIHKLIERPDINNKNQYVLQTETSYPYFHEFIQSYEKPVNKIGMGDEEKALAAAFELLLDYLRNTTDSVRSDPTISDHLKSEAIKKKLIDVRDKILSLKLIFIELDNEDDAYLIFETLNTRGKDLTVSDLVKNHLTKLLKQKNAKVDLPKDNWAKINSLFEESSADLKLDEFLHHYWLSTHDYVTTKKLFKSIKKNIGKSDAKDFLDGIVRESSYYRTIFEPNYGKWNKQEVDISSALYALNTFRVKQPMPMVLAIIREYKAKRISLKQTKDIIRAIEDFHFLFTAITSQRSSGGISFMFALHARQLYAAKTDAERNKTLTALKRKLKERIPPYAEFESNFIELKLSDEYTKQKNIVQYVLSGICKHFVSGVEVDYDKMTVEHLASQKPKVASGHTPDDIACIGNLLLVDQKTNKKLANKDFITKKEILSKSNTPMDEIVKTSKTWGGKEIQKRAKYLAKLAYTKIWTI